MIFAANLRQRHGNKSPVKIPSSQDHVAVGIEANQDEKKNRKSKQEVPIADKGVVEYQSRAPARRSLGHNDYDMEEKHSCHAIAIGPAEDAALSLCNGDNAEKQEVKPRAGSDNP